MMNMKTVATAWTGTRAATLIEGRAVACVCFCVYLFSNKKIKDKRPKPKKTKKLFFGKLNCQSHEHQSHLLSFSKLKMSSTMRLFVNDNRISTAVKTNSGLLQVYPEKKQFTDEVQWQGYWDTQLKPKIILRFGESEKPVAAASVPAVRVAAAPEPVPVSPPVARKKAKAPKKARMQDWNVVHANDVRTTLPPGEYYIGDLCYVLGDDIYDTIFGGNGYSDGVYEEKGTGRVFAVAGTAYGDGAYPGSDGNLFGVDAGIIGICSKSLMAKNDGGGHMYTFPTPFSCRFSRGRFRFASGTPQSLVIDTTGDDDAY
jgi:hypothetical protein